MIMLRSAAGEMGPPIAARLGCNRQTVRDALDDWNVRGIAALDQQSRSGVHPRKEARDRVIAAAAADLPAIPTKEIQDKSDA